MTLSPETLLATAATRTIVVCNACGRDPGDEPAPIYGCPEHGVELVEVECLRASALGLELPERNVPVARPMPTTEQLLASQRIRGLTEAIRRAARLADQSKQDAVPSFFGGVTEAA